MKTENVKDFLRRNYAFNGKKNMSVEGEDVEVKVASISSSSGPYCQIQRIESDDAKRFYIFCGESENGEANYIKKAIGESAHPNDDYIVAIELMRKFSEDIQTLRGMDFRSIMKKADAKHDVGIYRIRVAGTPVYNLIMIRVKENGQEINRYMDAYLASSDSCTFHDVRYVISQFEKKDSEVRTREEDVDWPHNLLIFGAPGTGKSFSIKEKVEKLDHVKRVTFYEDYSYEKFIGAYLPCEGRKENIIKGNNGDRDVNIVSRTDKSIEYRFVPGIFLQMITDAWFDRDNKYVLVIEEINRANAASVFGDFFQLLDRDEKGKSVYNIQLSDDMTEWLKEYLKTKEINLLKNGGNISINDKIINEYMERFEEHLNGFLQDFKLPENLYLWATMNSADQGVYPMDAAFKRRWSYLYKTAQENSGGERKIVIRWDRQGFVKCYEVDWDVVKSAINDQMGNVEEDRFLGPWFFNATETRQISEFSRAGQDKRMGLPDPITNKLFQYLRQDVFRNNPDQIFNDSYLTMNKIRQAMLDGEGINKILKLDNEKIKEIERILGEPVNDEISFEETEQINTQSGNGES